MTTLADVLDRAASSPAFMRRLKGSSGSFKVRVNGREIRVSYEKSQAGHFTFNSSVDEQTRVFSTDATR